MREFVRPSIKGDDVSFAFSMRHTAAGNCEEILILAEIGSSAERVPAPRALDPKHVREGEKQVRAREEGGRERA